MFALGIPKVELAACRSPIDSTKQSVLAWPQSGHLNSCNLCNGVAASEYLSTKRQPLRGAADSDCPLTIGRRPLRGPGEYLTRDTLGRDYVRAPCNQIMSGLASSEGQGMNSEMCRR